MSNFSSVLERMGLVKIIGWSFTAILGLVILFGSTYVVEQGNIGVVTRYGQIQSVNDPGLHMKLPIIDSVMDMPASLQTVEITATAVSRDIQQVQTRVNVQFSIPAGSMKYAFVNYRNDVKALTAAIIMPAVESDTKTITARYTADELITKREQVQSELKALLAKTLKESGGLLLVKVQVTDFGFSPDFTKSVEDNVVAERAVKTAQQVFERERVLAQQKVTDAKADADATRIRADAEAYEIKKQNENATELTVRLREADAKIAAAENMRNWRPTVIGAQPLVEVPAK